MGIGHTEDELRRVATRYGWKPSKSVVEQALSRLASLEPHWRHAQADWLGTAPSGGTAGPRLTAVETSPPPAGLPPASGVMELMAAYAGRHLSPVEVVRQCAARIDEFDRALNSVASVGLERALHLARESEDRWRHGRQLALDGIPFGVKDLIDVAGMPTTYGGRAFTVPSPARDARVVRLLTEHGAIPVCKLRTNELGCGNVLNPHAGPVRNPLNLGRITGGSSSGPAAAVAAGFVPFALATDAAGSTRVPAAYCGLTGFMPSHGSVRLDGVLTLSSTMDSVGALATTADDLALIATAFDLPAAGGRQRSRVRIGFPRAWALASCTPNVMRRVEEALAELAGLGATVRDVDLTCEDSEWIGWTILLGESANLGGAVRDGDGLLAHLAELDEAVSARLLAGMMVQGFDYYLALQQRARLRESMTSLFRDMDALVLPTVPDTAPAIESLHAKGRDLRDLQRATSLTIFANVAGLPAMSIPCGLDGSQMPVGLQIVGPRRAEMEMIRLAARYQQVTAFHRSRPDTNDIRRAGSGVARD